MTFAHNVEQLADSVSLLGLHQFNPDPFQP